MRRGDVLRYGVLTLVAGALLWVFVALTRSIGAAAPALPPLPTLPPVLPVSPATQTPPRVENVSAVVPEPVAEIALAYTASQDGQDYIYLATESGEPVARLDIWPAYEPAWSPDGTRLAFSAMPDGQLDVYVLDMDTLQLTNLTGHPSADATPAWSPDGTQVVFASNRDGDFDLYLTEAAPQGARTPVKLVAEDDQAPAFDAFPAWSPDGETIVFASNRDTGWFRLYRLDVESGEQRLLLPDLEGIGLYPAWSHDGAFLAFMLKQTGTYEQLAVLDIAGGRVDFPDAGDGDVRQAAWSPDDQRIVFASNRSGVYGLYLLELGSGAVTPLVAQPDAHNGDPAWR